MYSTSTSSVSCLACHCLKTASVEISHMERKSFLRTFRFWYGKYWSSSQEPRESNCAEVYRPHRISGGTSRPRKEINALLIGVRLYTGQVFRSISLIGRRSWSNKCKHVLTKIRCPRTVLIVYYPMVSGVQFRAEGAFCNIIGGFSWFGLVTSMPSLVEKKTVF